MIHPRVVVVCHSCGSEEEPRILGPGQLADGRQRAERSGRAGKGESIRPLNDGGDEREYKDKESCTNIGSKSYFILTVDM
jgi:hypothetical protein